MKLLTDGSEKKKVLEPTEIITPGKRSVTDPINPIHFGCRYGYGYGPSSIESIISRLAALEKVGVIRKVN